ncbi:MAG: pre-peptidase C-terminal domain-containing protein [Algicola sp.]|nr:pre-peptidase C-terminal domain-containing protein [Algicola sp.]
MKIQYKSVISAAFAGSLALAASAGDIDSTSTGFNTPPPLPPGTYLPKDANVIIAGESGSESVFYYYTLAEAGIVTFDMSGGTGDADLYAKLTATPTTTDYDCRPFLSGNEETCTIESPDEGMMHVGIHGFSNVSGVSMSWFFD